MSAEIGAVSSASTSVMGDWRAFPRRGKVLQISAAQSSLSADLLGLNHAPQILTPIGEAPDQFQPAKMPGGSPNDRQT